MFYEVVLKDKIRIPPSMLNMEVGDAALSIVRDLYERRFIKDVGFVLLIEKAKIEKEGVVIPGDPYIYYEVSFTSVVFSLSVNEVMRGFVKDIVDFGAFVSLGPLEGLLHISQISGSKYVFDKKTKSLVSQKEKKTVKKGDVVLVKVSTISWKNTIPDTKVGVTMRGSGLYDEEWKKEKKKKKKVENGNS